VTPDEAAAILEALAQRYADSIGNLDELDYDARALAESSGELEAIEALRLGAGALRRFTGMCTEEHTESCSSTSDPRDATSSASGQAAATSSR
jgi:hypothetical protein